MTPDQFTNWLSGFISALGSNPPTNEQFNTVKDNLEKVFNKVTPNRSDIAKPQTAREMLDCELIGGLTPIQDAFHKAIENLTNEVPNC